MIRYALLCEHDHEFESWFDSSGAYEKLQRAKLIECPSCGSIKTRKALMTPQLGGTRANRREETGGGVSQSDDKELHKLHKEATSLARKIRDHVEQSADNVGDNFANEARKIHFDEAAPRNIFGSATAKEATDLVEDGIDFTPLPDLPEDKN